MGFVTANILDIVNSKEESEKNEVKESILSSFYCGLNDEIDRFIVRDAFDFAEKKIAVTYFMYDEDNGNLLGFYTLTNKTIEISNLDSLTSKNRKRIKNYFTFDEKKNCFVGPCFLIAQISKNFKDSIDKTIEGSDLLDDAFEKLESAQRTVGGRFVYIECEDIEKVKKFYSDYGFVEVNKRASEEGVIYKIMIRPL